MLSWMECPGAAPTGVDQKLLAPWTLPMRSKYLGGLTGNSIILVIVFVVIAMLLTVLSYFRPDAAEQIGWPTSAWSVLLFLHQGNCVLAMQTLKDAKSTWPESFAGFVFACVYGIAVPCYFLWLHGEGLRTLEFRKYGNAWQYPSFLFFRGAWGPNTNYDRQSALFSDCNEDAPLWVCVLPMIFTVILSLVEALPLGCLAQSIIMAAMFGGNAAFHALVRPRRWWVLNVHGTLVNVLLCVYCVFSGAGVGGGASLLLYASYLNSVTSTIVGVASVIEKFWLRVKIWPLEGRTEVGGVEESLVIEMQERFTTEADDGRFHKLMRDLDALHREQADLLFKVSAPLPEVEPRVSDVTDDRFERLMTDLDELEDESEILFRRVGKMVAELY